MICFYNRSSTLDTQFEQMSLFILQTWLSALFYLACVV